jgi:hypothetical protein
MASSFSGLGGGRNAKFASAMQMMGDTNFGNVDPKSGAESRMRALEKASAWADRGIASVGGQGDFMADLQGQAANAGLQLTASNAIHEAQMEAARAAQSAQGLSGALGIASSVAGLFLCERRLKTDITSLDSAHAWSVVRDLPLYSFHYKANPGPTVYGPMIDEVEPLDPSLVRPSLMPPDEQGPIRGFDVMRHQAYESAALQAALHRIEGLEADLGKLQDALARLLLEKIPTLEAA